jgi:uncharacterized damage-inducible protein DinB
MIHHVKEFIAYFESVRRRTLTYVRCVPEDRADWAPLTGEFTCGAIIRHLAAAETMFVGVVVEGQWHYSGHEHGPTRLPDLLVELEQDHAAAMSRLRGLSDDQLTQPRPSLQGPPVRAWRWLMAMTEHEIHHRSQLAVYLRLMDVPPPHIFGLGVEDVIALATG